MPLPWEFVDHTADYALRAWGEDFRSLVENAARGFTHLLADLDGLRPDEWLDVVVEGDGREQVLIHALKEILRLHEDGRLVVEVRVPAADATRAALQLGTVDRALHADRLLTAVKAVTYHGLNIAHEADGLSVIVVFDT
jgi:SHS2 domain-containing protein